MSDEIKQLLNSPDAADRKEAIRRLAKLGDVSALTYLSAIYRTDPDEEIRQLALKAGRFIKQNSSLAALSTQEVMAAPTISPYAVVEEPPVLTPEETALQQRKARGEELMKLAKAHFDNRERVQARKLAVEALDLYPQFTDDLYYLELLGQIMEVRTEYVLSEIEDYRRPGYEKRKIRRANQSLDDTTALQALTYLVLIALVAMGGAAAMFVAVSQLMQPQLALAATVTAQDPVRGTFLQNSMGSFVQLLNFSTRDLQTNLTRGALLGGQLFGALLVAYVVVGFAARAFFDGDGTWGGLVRATYKPVIVGLIVLYVGYGVLSYLYLSPVLEGLHQTLSANQPAPYEQAIQNAQPIGAALALFVLAVIFGFSAPVSRGIARNYRLGVSQAWSALLLAGIAATASGCGLLLSLASTALA
jgi:hypothetical protein